MRIVRHRLSNRACGAVLTVLMVLLVGLVPIQSVFAATGVSIPYKQTWKNNSGSNVSNTFEYRLTSVDGAPLPGGSSGDYYSFTAKGNEEGTLELNFNFSKPGYYKYKVKQYVAEKKKNYKYDNNTYDLMIMVINKDSGLGVGAITIEDSEGKKYTKLPFTVEYGKKSEPSGSKKATPSGGGEVEPVEPEPPEPDIPEPTPVPPGPLPPGIDYWALLNLILMLLTVLVALINALMYFRNPRDEYGEEYEDEEVKKHGTARIIAIVLAIISIIVFFLTEDMRLPMEWVDEYTIWMLILFVATVIVVMMSKKEADDDDGLAKVT